MKEHSQCAKLCCRFLLKTVLKVKKSVPGIKDPAAELLLWPFCTFFAHWMKCKHGWNFFIINTSCYVHVPCYYPCYKHYGLFCGCVVYITLVKPANAGKKAITSKYIMQELNTITLKFHVVFYILHESLLYILT